MTRKLRVSGAWVDPDTGSSEWSVDSGVITAGATVSSQRFDATTGVDLAGCSEFLIEIEGNCVDTSVGVVDVMARLNNDSAANAYYYTLLGRMNGFLSGDASGTSGRIGRLPGTLTNANRWGRLAFQLSAPTTAWKVGDGRYGLQASNANTNNAQVGVVEMGWVNTTDPVTRIDVFPATGSGFATGTKIRLRAR